MEKILSTDIMSDINFKIETYKNELQANNFEKLGCTLQESIDSVYQSSEESEINDKPKKMLQNFGVTCQHIVKTFETLKILDLILPRKYIPDTLTGSNYLSQEDFQKMSFSQFTSEPIWNLLESGGKRMRPCILIMVDQLSSNSNTKNALIVAGMIELLHNCSLIIDDIQDNSEKRRNKLASHVVYGTDFAINSACFGYFKCMDI